MNEKCDTHICNAFTSSDIVESPVSYESRPMYLIVVSGGTPGNMLRLTPSDTGIGRSDENAVRFTDLSISRRHASIVTDAHDDVWLTDLGSSNGTFLNSGRLAGPMPQRLHDGDRIQFGTNVVVEFVRLDPCDEQFQRTLFERTVRDPLTALYNRSFFLDQLDPLTELGASRGLGLAVLMLDIDHFKRVNDSFGHDAGDAVLCEVADVLRESTRDDDLVARYGGEEFVAALPVATPDQASERAERIRADLAARRIAVPGGGPLRVTASLGLAFARPGRVRSASSLITTADHCLYQAKNGGRNRVVLSVDHPFVTDRELATPCIRGA